MSLERLVADADGTRLDAFIAQKLGIARSFAKKLIDEGRVSAEGGRVPQKLKPATRIIENDIYNVDVPPPESLELEPEEVSFDVVYEDQWLLVINKPAGLVVHPAPGNWRGTLVHGLLWRYPDMGPFNNVHRPGIVHRLDATTSGLMVVAREQKTMEVLQRDFKERSVHKTYLALTHGSFSSKAGTLEGPIGRNPQNRLKMAVIEGGRPAATSYEVLWNTARHAFVKCGLITGRTHQIRVHMAAAGHPLVGDALYGAQDSGLDRVFLHSWRLSLTHPATGEELSFTCPLPAELRKYLRLLLARETPARTAD